jgi:hypothetical protein
VFVLGLVVGSFLNVVIYRLPIMLEREWRSQAAELLPLASAAAPVAAAPAAVSGGSQRAVHPEHASLGLPGLQGSHHGVAEHPRDELADAARTLRVLQSQDLLALSHGGTDDRIAVGLGRLAFRLRRAGGLAPC